MSDAEGIILVIEDDPGAATLQRKCLERKGYRVFTAASRESAWEVLESHPVQLILLDYKLQQHETGLDMLRELQTRGRDIPCIVVTGFANEQLAIEAFRAGARDFLPKSVTYLDSLPQAVDRVFREIRQSEELRRSDLERRRLVHDLGERVKELTLLREASRLLQDSTQSTDDLVSRLVEMIPTGFQWPEKTAARITLGNHSWTGLGFRPSPTMVRVGFKVGDDTEGIIEVSVLDVPLSSGDPPFLQEEETLLASIGEMLLMNFDRRRAWEQLRRNEQRYRSLVESSTVVIWTADASGKINNVSPVRRDIRYEEVERALGDGWADLTHPDDLPHITASWQRSVETLQTHHATGRLRRDDGAYMYCDFRAVPIFDEQGHVLEWFGTVHDVTQQREYEDTLARLASIVASSDDAIVSSSPDGVVIGWNPGAESIYGYASTDMLCRPLARIVPPERLAEFAAVLQRVANGEAVEPFETVWVRRDNSRVEVLIRVFPVRDSKGKVTAISWIHHVITERKAAERRRQLHQATLQILVDTASIEEAAYRLIDSVCQTMGWAGGGGLWLLDERDQVLRLAAATFDDDHRLASYGEFSRKLTFKPGVGLPGEAWLQGKPIWIGDFDQQTKYPRSEIARQLGLHSAVALPLKVGDRTLGVLDFFGERIAPPSPDDLAALSSVSSQFALFIDRKLTELKREQLAAILEASTDFVGLTDPEGTLLYLNRAGREMLGIDLNDARPLHLRQCVPPWAADLLRTQAMPSAVRDGSWTGEAAIWSGKCAEIAVSMLLLAHRNASGDVEFFSMIGRDITEQKQNRESLLLHNRAMAATSEGIVITGPAADDAPILYANEAFLKMTGYELSQVIGRNCRFLQGANSDPATVEQMRLSIVREEACTVEILNYKADGTPFWNLISVTPVRDANGQVTHYVGTHRDVTERRRMEAQLRQTQKMEAIGSLAGGIAHDFNNMLTVILGYGEMARESLAAENAANALLEEIISAAQRAATLTSQLLAFSRRQVIAPQQVDLNSILRDLQRLLRPLISENIAIKQELTDGLWPVRVDPNQFEQIVMNLIINSRDAMPAGGNLLISTQNLVIDGELTRASADLKPGEYVVLTVSDTGCGMSPDVLTRIFEPFFTTKPKGKGTGMGLATVYGIVKQSAGHITVASHEGIGTTFQVYLPRSYATSEEADAKPNDPAGDHRWGSETVLLVEDEKPVREFARRVLLEHGYRVLEASRGDEALSLMKTITEPVHVLVTDIVMPGMDGRQLAETLLASHPNLKVLYLSGYSDEILSDDSLPTPRSAFLQKPFNRVSLSTKLGDLLDSNISHSSTAPGFVHSTSSHTVR